MINITNEGFREIKKKTTAENISLDLARISGFHDHFAMTKFEANRPQIWDSEAPKYSNTRDCLYFVNASIKYSLTKSIKIKIVKNKNHT